MIYRTTTVLPCAFGSLFMISILNACGSTTPATLGELSSGYTYVPVDPFRVASNIVSSKPGEGVPPQLDSETLLKCLPDNTVRMSVEEFTAAGNVKYGPASVATEGSYYRVTVDYTSSDTKNLQLWVAKKAEFYDVTKPSAERTYDYVVGSPFAQNDGRYTYGTETYVVHREKPATEPDKFVPVNVPVYVGIGLRVTAYLTSKSGKANISGIGVIGAEAEADNLSGNLVVQTLGINGQAVAAALPIQSELNRTTAQNAISAIGAVKALIYENSTVTPRVVGLYLPFPGGKPLVNAIISSLSEQSVDWTCAPPVVAN